MQVLEQGRSIRIRGGSRVVCLAGTVWITQAGDPRDLFLRPHEALVVGRTGVALAQAWEQAVLRVEPPAGGGAARLLRLLGIGHGACRPAPE